MRLPVLWHLVSLIRAHGVTRDRNLARARALALVACSVVAAHVSHNF